MDILKLINFTYKDVLTDVDLNTITAIGIYYATTGLTNSPATAPWGVLFVLGRIIEPMYLMQLLIDQYGNIWSRRLDKSWKKSSDSN